MKSLLALLVLVFPILLGCTDKAAEMAAEKAAERAAKIENLFQKDHVLSVQARDQIRYWNPRKIDAEMSSNIEDRRGVIYAFQELDDGNDVEIKKAIDFLKGENDYCTAMYNISIVRQNADMHRGARYGLFRSENAYDRQASSMAYEADDIRKLLIKAEPSLAQYHWDPVWSKKK